MKSLSQALSEIVGQAFVATGYNPVFGQVVESKRPELSQFQCNGALAAANQSQPRGNPRELATKIVEQLAFSDVFSHISLAGPGFINLSVSDAYLADHVLAMTQDDRLGCSRLEQPRRVVVDFGGANVAKRMHVGHLRASIIGDCLRRLFQFRGDEVIGDIHMGDWGTQMGQLIVELQTRHPDWPYFDEQNTGPYPLKSPVTMDDFAVIYPLASAKSKDDPQFAAAARQATRELQAGRPGYRALWQHFVDVSVAALRADSDMLGVHFDLWYGESHAAPRMEGMIARLKDQGYAVESQEALVIAVDQPEDKKEIPPLMLTKSDGAVLYGSTDLATIEMRVDEFKAERILYVVDQRQSLHFEQVFRAAWKTGIAAGVELEHLGFGTMNGPDGRPFKTRTGGVMELNDLMAMVIDKAYQRLSEIEMATDYDEMERQQIAHQVGLAALKFADLINQRTKDYRFDLERFTEFEGRTGPYLLYTAVRTKSILRKAATQELVPGAIIPAINDQERQLMLALTLFPESVNFAYDTRMPNHLAEYVYNLSMVFNRFYRENHILSEEDPVRQASWLALIQFFLAVTTQTLDLLGIAVPERM